MSGTPSHLKKPHNKTLFIYHLVCPVKYRRDVFTPTVSKTFTDVCLEFGPAYDIHFFEVGLDEDNVHFLIQTIPNIGFSEMAKKIKSITANIISSRHTKNSKLNSGEESYGRKATTIIRLEMPRCLLSPIT